MFKKGSFSIDDALDGIDMSYKNYTPSIESLEFFSIIKVFMGEDFEVANCKFHYFIVDMLFGLVKPEDFPYSKEVIETLPLNPSRIGIIASRGSAKSTITTTFYPIYCAIKGETPLIKKISHMLILSDSAQGGARDQAKLLGGEFEKSKFAKEYFEKMRFTESEVELVRKGSGPIEPRHILIKFKGAQSGGIRSGSRNPVTRDRYSIIIGDDVIKNESESYSEIIMKNVRTALESDALNAMRGRNTQLVLINTPFHKFDPIYKALESGVYTPLVAPICKEVHEDITRAEFEPLWEDMHDYDSIMQRYLNAKAGNSTRSFNQELMLRVSSEEDRMINDSMLQTYDRSMLMKMLDGYSLYITTDFTTTSAAKSDYSAIGVWAVSSNMDYYLLDLHVKRCEIHEQYDALFRMVSVWSRGGRYIEVGVEIDGQQKAHIFSLKEMMIKKGIHFSFAKQKGAPVGREGILSKGAGGNKLERFRYMLPQFQNMKMYFPNELSTTPDMKEAVKQMKGATHTGFSGHDDWNDCVSQLGMMDILAGSGVEYGASEFHDDTSSIWKDIEEDDDYQTDSVVF